MGRADTPARRDLRVGQSLGKVADAPVWVMPVESRGVEQAIGRPKVSFLAPPRTHTGGHDLTLSAEAGLTYWLNRYVGLTTRARHERQTSTIPGRGYEANSIFLGMRLQR